MNSQRIPIITFLLGFLFAGNVLASSKIDTIYFQNGDRVTAEVKSLENNQLRLSTDDAGTIRVEWNKVDSVKILNSMRIVLQDGEILYGKLLPSGEVKSGYIWHRTGDPMLVELERIVLLSPIEDRFVNRLDGSLSSGFSYIKASQVMQMHLNASIQYTAEKNHFELFYDGMYTREPESDNSQRQNGGATFLRILPKKWFLLSQVSAENSSEQQLDLRTNFGVGGGNSLIRTNSTHFYIAGGIQANRELSMGISQYNLEGMIASNYSVFIFDSPEVSFNINAKVIPSLNDFGRIRSQVDSNLKWEMFNDFYLKWTFFYSFDNRPLSETAEKSDWAITLLGLEYSL
ncbi:MAG: DUF481 domain-containing protein [Bacteroidota bacterium]